MRRHQYSGFGSCCSCRHRCGYAKCALPERQHCCAAAAAGLGQPNATTTTCTCASGFRLLSTRPLEERCGLADGGGNGVAGAVEAKARIARTGARACRTRRHLCLCIGCDGVEAGLGKRPAAAWQECLPIGHGDGWRIAVSYTNPD